MDIMGLKQLAELINEHCGIDYTNNLSSLDNKVSSRVKELGLSYWEYCGYLKVEISEWDVLIELITVNETYFFREENLLEEFRRYLLDNFVKYSVSNPLRIWCAACSSGEEPYTLGMIIEELGLFMPGAVQIIATDINKKVLNKAQSGLYNKKSFSFRRMPIGAIEKFFLDKGDDYQIKPSIRSMVEFKHLNLLDSSSLSQIRDIDIIFCRNVLIYFDKDTIQKIVDSFYNILKNDGILYLGHSESLSYVIHKFETYYTDNIFFYKKEGD